MPHASTISLIGLGSSMVLGCVAGYSFSEIYEFFTDNETNLVTTGFMLGFLIEGVFRPITYNIKKSVASDIFENHNQEINKLVEETLDLLTSLRNY